MADDATRDAQALEDLRKALEKAASTAQVRNPWQEHFGRETSAEASRTVMSADIVRGLSGSWASSYNFGFGATTDRETINTFFQDTSIPKPIREKILKVGQAGFPDVDFVPYNWRTNRMTVKGPSLVGHPISFEVCGPTMKSEFCDWTWRVDQGAGANGGDVLTMEVRSDGAAATCQTLAEGYDLSPFTIGDPSEPNGGLYVIISSDGANPGSIYQPGPELPMGALPDHVDTARFEIFRIAELGIAPGSGLGFIELHPNKPLSNYFDLPLGATRYIRAITIIKPYVTRLMAIPSSGPAVGREQTYVVVSPEVAASPDAYPPYDGGNVGDGTWLQGGFDADGTGLVGAVDAYGGKAVLPVPAPIRQGLGHIEKSPAVASTDIGHWILEAVENGSTADVGRVLRIYHVESDDGDTLLHGDPVAAVGWFEVVDVGPLGDTYTLKRVAEIDTLTGIPYFGPGPYHQQPGAPFITVFFTVHEPVSALFQGPFDIDGTMAARLDCLIDPRMVEPSTKQVSDPVDFPRPPGSSPARGDRSIFSTRQFPTGGLPEADNPGSLMDLGFRMVLFPSKDDGSGNPIPDYDRPINARELTIDPDITTPQFLTIDYSAGTVKLSDPPPPSPRVGGFGDIIPDGIIGGPGTTNPREEVVLWCACVPYSRDPCQKGTGVRIVGRDDEDVDVFGARIVANIDLVNSDPINATPPHFTGDVALDAEIDIPEQGFFDVLDGALGTSSNGTWGYQSRRVDNFGGGDVTVLENVYSDPNAVDPQFLAAPSIVIRRELFFGQGSADNSALIDDVRFDTVYGDSHRPCVLRFRGANCTMQVDGSILVNAGGVDVQDEGVAVALPAKTLNFVGAGVTASPGLPGVVDVAIPGGAAGVPAVDAYLDQGAGADADPIFTDIPPVMAKIGALPVLSPGYPITNTLHFLPGTFLAGVTPGVYSMPNTLLHGTAPIGFSFNDASVTFTAGNGTKFDDIRSFKDITFFHSLFAVATTFAFTTSPYCEFDNVSVSSPTNGSPTVGIWDSVPKLRMNKSTLDVASFDVPLFMDVDVGNNNFIGPSSFLGAGTVRLLLKGTGNTIFATQVATLDIEIGDGATGSALFSGANPVTFGSGGLTTVGTGTSVFLRPGGGMPGDPVAPPFAGPFVASGNTVRGICRGIHVQGDTVLAGVPFDVSILEAGVVKYFESFPDIAAIVGGGVTLSTTFGELAGSPDDIEVIVTAPAGILTWDFINVTFFVK